MVRKGGQLKVHARSTWGEGGQKRPKNGPHGLCMTPYDDISSNYHIVHFLFENSGEFEKRAGFPSKYLISKNSVIKSV